MFILVGLSMAAGNVLADTKNSYNWGYTLYNTASSGSMEGKVIAQDASGNVYIAGNFYGTVNFNPSGGNDTVTTTDYDSYYFSKYDSTGQYLWTKTVSGAKVRAITSVEYIDYSMSQRAKSTDIFLSKFDSTGAFLWTDTAGGEGADNLFGMVVDATGNAYLTGVIYPVLSQYAITTDKTDLNPGDATTLFASNGNTAFLTKWGTEATVVEDFFTPVFSLNQSVFMTGERHLLTLSMTASYSQPVDIYVGVMIPGGQIYCLNSDLQLTNSLTPWKSNWTVATISQTTMLDMHLQGIPAGPYTWYLVIVKAGDNVMDTNNWIKQQSLSFSYTGN